MKSAKYGEITERNTPPVLELIDLRIWKWAHPSLVGTRERLADGLNYGPRGLYRPLGDQCSIKIIIIYVFKHNILIIWNFTSVESTRLGPWHGAIWKRIWGLARDMNWHIIASIVQDNHSRQQFISLLIEANPWYCSFTPRSRLVSMRCPSCERAAVLYPQSSYLCWKIPDPVYHVVVWKYRLPWGQARRLGCLSDVYALQGVWASLLPRIIQDHGRTARVLWKTK